MSQPENAETNGGTEISFVDFRNHFLGHVEKIQIINRQVARFVVRRPDAMLDHHPVPPSQRPDSTMAERRSGAGSRAVSGGGGGDDDGVFDDETQMTFEQTPQNGSEMGSFASGPTRSTTTRHQNPEYFFYVRTFGDPFISFLYIYTRENGLWIRVKQTLVVRRRV